MYFFAGPFFASTVGALVSVLLIEVWVFRNPARIPFSQFAFRALSGVGLLLVLWIPLSFAIYRVSANFLIKYPSVPEAAYALRHPSLLAFLIGFLAPQLSWLPSLLIQESSPQWLRSILTLMSEATVTYLPKIINREERKVAYGFTNDRSRDALDRLYEFHAGHIALAEVRRTGDPENAQGPLRSRDPGVNLNYLLRFLKYKTFMLESKGTLYSPGWVLPGWYPFQQSKRLERRRCKKVSKPADNRALLYGRRRLDSPYLTDYIEFITRPSRPPYPQ